MEPLDLLGTVVLSLSVVILLVLGLPLVRGINTKKNLMRHGMLATSALVAQTILLLIMLPSFARNFSHILTLPPVYAFNSWLHFTLGSAAIISGFIYAGLWLTYYSSGLKCTRAKKFMLPTLIIWAAAIATGGLIHVLQMF